MAAVGVSAHVGNGPGRAPDDVEEAARDTLAGPGTTLAQRAIHMIWKPL